VRVCACWLKRHRVRLNLVAANLAGLPPVTLISADVDPLRSDADLLEKKLRHAGVEVVHETFKGVVHEFFGMPRRIVAKAGAARDLAVSRILAAWIRAGGSFVVAPKAMESTHIKDARDRDLQTTTNVV
jgi:acetyl esterase/lipase